MKLCHSCLWGGLLIVGGLTQVSAQTERAQTPQAPVTEPEIFDAARSGDTDRLEILLAMGADVNVANESGQTPLHVCAPDPFGLWTTMDMLLKSGADVDAADNEGRTALMHAAENGQLEAVILLLQYGADASIRDNAGKTALELARDNSQRAIVDVLIGR